MKVYLLFIAFFLTAQAAGQPVQKIKWLLKEKEFVALKNYIDKPQKSNVGFGWETLRTIVGDYQEGVIQIQEMLPANDGTGGNYVNNYRIYLLANQGRIFYYTLVKSIYKNTGQEQWDESEEIIDRFTDNKEYSLFENSFRQIYGDKLNPDDLFLTSIVFGEYCGFAGVHPEYMEQLNLLLINNRVDEIRKWLKSANAEKQLYAIKGYRILVNQGYNLTDEEKRIIAIVKDKKGMVSTCGGCLRMKLTIQNVVSEINSIPPENLKPDQPASSEAEINVEPDTELNILPKKKGAAMSNLSIIGLFSLVLVFFDAISYFSRRRQPGGRPSSNI